MSNRSYQGRPAAGEKGFLKVIINPCHPAETARAAPSEADTITLRAESATSLRPYAFAQIDCERFLRAVPSASSDMNARKQNRDRGPIPANAPCITVNGILRSMVLWIRAVFARRAQERRMKAEIAYYSNLPDWVLRDIGMERQQIAAAVRSAHQVKLEDRL